MDHSTSYVRIIIVVVAAATIWFLSTFVPSPYKKDTALVPMGPVHQAPPQEPLSYVPGLPVHLA
jgi:hypothetical protein